MGSGLFFRLDELFFIAIFAAYCAMLLFSGRDLRIVRKLLFKYLFPYCFGGGRRLSDVCAAFMSRAFVKVLLFFWSSDVEMQFFAFADFYWLSIGGTRDVCFATRSESALGLLKLIFHYKIFMRWVCLHPSLGPVTRDRIGEIGKMFQLEKLCVLAFRPRKVFGELFAINFNSEISTFLMDQCIRQMNAVKNELLSLHKNQISLPACKHKFDFFRLHNCDHNFFPMFPSLFWTHVKLRWNKIFMMCWGGLNWCPHVAV